MINTQSFSRALDNKGFLWMRDMYARACESLARRSDANGGGILMQRGFPALPALVHGGGSFTLSCAL
jgi:hypothetical protein